MSRPTRRSIEGRVDELAPGGRADPTDPDAWIEHHWLADQSRRLGREPRMTSEEAESLARRGFHPDAEQGDEGFYGWKEALIDAQENNRQRVERENREPRPLVGGLTPAIRPAVGPGGAERPGSGR